MLTHPITFGETRRVLSAGDFVLREVRYAPRTEIPPHAHDRALFVFVIAGDMKGTTAGTTATYAPRSLRALPAGGTHSNTYGEGSHLCLLIEPDAGRVQQLGPRGACLDGFSYYGPRALPAVLAGRAYHELREGDPVAPLAIEGLLLELLATIARSSSPFPISKPPAWLLQLRDALNDEFRSPVSLAEIAARHGVHPVHVARLFRTHFGCTPSAYVRRLRIDWSSEALRRTHLGVATVARDAGYADQSHFTREFRKAMGVTPARYRAVFAG